MTTLDLEANKRIIKLEADVEHYKSLADLLQIALEESEEENRALKGQLALMRQDHRYSA